MKSSIWSSERTKQLKVMWMEGLPASHIASHLGGNTTRNSVIGKVHRMKWIRPEKTKTPVGGALMLDLDKNQCHWPVGDPGDEGFHYCGQNRDHRFPYCTKHAKEAYPKIV